MHQFYINQDISPLYAIQETERKMLQLSFAPINYL